MNKAAMMLLGLSMLAGCGKAEFTCSETRAYGAAQRIIERHLKAPSTADFPSSNSSQVKVTEVSKCKYRIQAYVDAQNAFGAKIRTPFSITVEGFPAKDEWQGSDLSM
ncbi:hypothetical protein K8U54_18020 [Pseudomonas fulva]|uniref:hypothetical protein n=1 Tax=Pseudomonas fulva TaxID=47880 RepID=UPI00201D4399|nr:hypothetical protein [Pseudomonas fulva]UQY33599.1 hypothetical protein K8U54_18020 [Pseudomonas fulva]